MKKLFMNSVEEILALTRAERKAFRRRGYEEISFVPRDGMEDAIFLFTDDKIFREQGSFAGFLWELPEPWARPGKELAGKKAQAFQRGNSLGCPFDKMVLYGHIAPENLISLLEEETPLPEGDCVIEE